MADENARKRREDMEHVRHLLEQYTDVDELKGLESLLDSTDNSKSEVEDEDPNLPTAWLYVPFDAYIEDQVEWVASILEEHQRSPRGKRNYKVIYHQDGSTGLSQVKPDDQLYVLAHGSDTGEFIAPVEQFTEKTQHYKLTPDQLAKQMLDSGLNPSEVRIKLAMCYTGGLENPESGLQALATSSFARDYAQTLGNNSLKRGVGLPASIDGYVGMYYGDMGPVTENPNSKSPARHYSAGVPDNLVALINQDIEGQTSFNQEILMSSGMLDEVQNVTARIRSQERMKNQQQYRARDNRVRYEVTKIGPNAVEVTVDQLDLDRAKQERAKHNKGLSLL